MSRAPSASEHDQQVALIRWFELSHRSLAGRLVATPNGGQRHPAVAARLKAEGVRRGFPDLHLPVAMGGFHGLFIELKKQGGRATPEQKDWLSFLESAGYRAELCIGWQAAAAVIDDYLGVKK